MSSRSQLIAAAFIVAGIAAFVLRGNLFQMPPRQADESSVQEAHEHDHAAADHRGHDHGHGGHDHSGDHSGHRHDHGEASGDDHESNALRLSDEATRSIGLVNQHIRKIEFEDFWRSVIVPAQVVDRPGRTQVHVATPMTGMIVHVHVGQGEAVVPGTLLLRIRLTHEDLLQLQTEFLQTIGELDVEEKEIERLTDVTSNQAVPGVALLEREYQRDRLTAARSAQAESLRMHGLSDQQIQGIAANRRLIRELDIVAPGPESHASDADLVHSGEAHRDSGPDDLLVLQQLNVQKGQQVAAGTTLCVLKDYSQLLIEGRVLEKDVATVRHLLKNDQDISAVVEQPGQAVRITNGLRIDHLANEADTESRSVRLYVRLQNVCRVQQRGELRFVEWQWLPGQRLQLRLPVQRWKKQIAVPVQAVTQQGEASYVFRRHNGHFDRVRIQEKHRDQHFVVIERDGALSPGNEIAWRGAHEMLLALRSQTATPFSSHGHSHPHPH
jgi:cobalt-zinc-cadmium efflux system membrane fusion protein